MSAAAVGLICAIVIIVLAYNTLHLMRYIDDYYRQQFNDYLQDQKRKNPNLFANNNNKM